MARRRARACWALAVAAAVAFPLQAQTTSSAEADPLGQTSRESRPLGLPRASDRAVPRTSGENAGGTRLVAGERGLLDHAAVRTGGSLAIVLTLIFGLARMARRLNAVGLIGARSSAPAGILEILGRYPVGRGQWLVLLRLDTRVLLLSQSSPGFRLRGGGGSGGMVTLATIEQPEDVASILTKVQSAADAGGSIRFGEVLGDHDRRHADSAGVVEVGRAVRRGRGGDRAELWDPAGAPASFVGSLRDRLAAFRAAAGGGGR